MIRKLIGLATALALPSLLAAQTPTIPNGHASPKGQTMAGAHSQSAQHRATQRRGEVAGGLSNRPGSIATPAVGRASFGVGVGTVRDTGGTTFSSGSFSPTLHFAAPTVSADVSSSFASLPGGVWSSQGRGDLWLASRPIRDGWRIGVEGILAGISWTDGGWTAAAHGIGELLWSRPRWGVGVGAGPSARGI